MIPGLERSLWRREWQPTPVFLLGESHGQGSLVGCSPCDHILISKQNDLLNEQILYLKVFPPPLAFFFSP